MSGRKKIFPNMNPGSKLIISEPRYIVHREQLTLTKFNIFNNSKEDDEDIDLSLDHEQSNAIFDIEIANQLAARRNKKK